MCVCRPGMDKHSVTHSDSALVVGRGGGFLLCRFLHCLGGLLGMTVRYGGKEKQRKSIKTFYDYNRS